ncbi:hypothetical protein ASZ90_015329 [hydrocarbon metagenome]|uniref:Uncharacterized protein n=1 Tax=hydrocarbon metagenome TaxID=938273 RepID=A0A0W8F2G3_9ZZZZ
MRTGRDEGLIAYLSLTFEGFSYPEGMRACIQTNNPGSCLLSRQDNRRRPRHYRDGSDRWHRE